MSIVQTIGRMLLGGSIRRALWRSPKAIVIAAALFGLVLLSVGNARAHNVSECQTHAQQCTQAQAYALASSQALADAHCAAMATGWTAGPATAVTTSATSYGLRSNCVRPDGNPANSPFNFHSFIHAGCPANAPWNPDTGTCGAPLVCSGGAVKLPGGECSATPDECLAFNSGGGFGVQTTKPFSSKTLANGCVLKMTQGQCTKVANLDATIELCNGEFEFTGEVSGEQPPDVSVPGPTTPEEAAQQSPQECVAAGSNQTMCVKANGQHCHTTSRGNQICWQGGETGTKTDGPVAQVRNAGTQAVTPNLNLPSGDTLTKTGSSVTTTTNGQGSGQGSTTTTTTTNYTTIHGTNAGTGKDKGQPSDGSGDEESDEEGSASGGANCEQKPIVSDPMLEMVATQAWATRCAVEAGNAVKVTGDVGDCASPFSVEGDDANAVKLRAMRAQICNDNQPEWTKGDGPEVAEDTSEGDVADAKKFGLGIGLSMLDDSDLFGGGTCPQMSFTLMGASINSTDMPQWCNVIAIMRALILIFGAYTALMILMGKQYG